MQNRLINGFTVNFTTGTSRVRFIAANIRVHSILKLCVLSINGWLEEHIILSSCLVLLSLILIYFHIFICFAVSHEVLIISNAI